MQHIDLAQSEVRRWRVQPGQVAAEIEAFVEMRQMQRAQAQREVRDILEELKTEAAQKEFINSIVWEFGYVLTRRRGYWPR